MASAAQKKDPEVLKTVAGKIYATIIAVYLCVIFGVFPLYFEDYYFNILVAKYRFYWMATVALLVICLVAALVFMVVDQRKYGGILTRAFLDKFRIANLKKQPVVYKALAAFWLLAAISTVLSDYVYESFWGNEGRFSGLFLISLYVLSVFVIGKLGRMKRWYLDVFLLSSVLVCLFGITDYFRMDILHWKTGVESVQLDSFTSTMGNINTYTAFVALTMAVACGLFVTEAKWFRRIWYYVVILIAFFAIVTGQSDNAYLALGILFAVLPLVLFRTWKGIADYALLAASFMEVIKVIDVINIQKAGQVIGLSGLFDFLVKYEHLEVIVIALWAITAVLYGVTLMVCRKGENGYTGKMPVILWAIFLAVCTAVVVYVFYDANFGSHPERYAPIARYVVFDDAWGTNRGYCWRIGWESYMKQPFLHKLFGFGPDTFGILTWDFREEAIASHGVFYESAHNEYLQYLVTMGPLALAAYLVFLADAFRRMMCGSRIRGKNGAGLWWVLAPALAVLCYGTQAIVNINLPIATPLMWALLAAGLAAVRPGQGSERPEQDAERPGQGSEKLKQGSERRSQAEASLAEEAEAGADRQAAGKPDQAV